jgi:hypothetical protein
MKYKIIKVKAKKDGEFNTGEPFCKKGNIYDAKIYEDGDVVIEDHNMSNDYFKEYFDMGL